MIPNNVVDHDGLVSLNQNILNVLGVNNVGEIVAFN